MSAGQLALKKHPTEGQQCEDLQRLKISKTFFCCRGNFQPIFGWAFFSTLFPA